MHRAWVMAQEVSVSIPGRGRDPQSTRKRLVTAHVPLIVGQCLTIKLSDSV